LRVFHVPDDLSQETHVDGLPLGTRGGLRVRHTFPVHGVYVIKARLQRTGSDYVPVFAEPHQLAVALDGTPLETFTLEAEAAPARTSERETARGGNEQARESIPADRAGSPAERRERRKRIDANWQIRVPISAGAHEVTVAFVRTTAALNESPRRPFLRPYGIGQGPDSRVVPYLGDVEISGPYDPVGWNDSPSRRVILVCQPTKVTEESACAKKIVSNLAQRAYRRPVTDGDLQVLLRFFDEGRKDGSFEQGIEFAIERLLVSPEFLFRAEPGASPPAARTGRAVRSVPPKPKTPSRISDLELASRLSFFLWSSVPDRELLDLAAAGTLHDPAVLDRQVGRMLQDPRSEALVTNFAGQWLYLRNVPSVAPPGFQFPDFDDSLRSAFRRETELFFASIIRDDRGVLELLTADYTFVNERLARHYGIKGVTGSRFRRVTLDNDARRGLLGQGSILAVTSYANRTSPVKRGKWILENLLGTPPPLPPPNVPSLKEEGESIAHLTMRQRMEQHRANPACASCHKLMDPLGFALENFDAVGRFRVHDESFSPIDSAGLFPDGTNFMGPQGLRQVLVDHADQFVHTVTEKLLTYALGRGIEYYDAPAIRQIRREAAANDYRFSAIVMGIVKSVPFQLRPQS
jgi:hypothetical protein